MRKRKPVFWLLLLSILLTLMVPALISGLKGFGQLSRLPWLLAIGLGVLMVLSWFFNGARVRHLLKGLGKPVSGRQAVIIAISAEFAGHATPASSGMPVTFAFLLKDLGLKLGRAMGLVGIIMALDILFFLSAMLLALIALVVRYSLSRTEYLAGLALAVAGGAIFSVWLGIRHYRAVYHFISRQMARFRWTVKYRYSLARTTVEFIRALKDIRALSWGIRIKLALHTVAYWLPRYSVLIIAVGLVSKHVPVAYLFLIQGLLNIGSEAFLIPAGGGGVDALFYGLLAPFLSAGNIVFCLIVWRVYTFYLYLVLGGPIFLMRTGKAAKDLLRG